MCDLCWSNTKYLEIHDLYVYAYNVRKSPPQVRRQPYFFFLGGGIFFIDVDLFNTENG